jgi:hypothetical protein
MLEVMLGFWPQLLIVLVALYFAGVVFANTAIGRWFLLIPVLMGFVPFVWHVQQTVTTLRPDYPDLTTRFVALALGLGVITLAIGIVWAWQYAFSIFALPLLTLLIYYFGPWLYLQGNVPAPLLPVTDTISLFAVLASLCLLAYTLPYIRNWLSSANTSPDDQDSVEEK